MSACSRGLLASAAACSSGIAAAEVQAVDVGQPRVGQRGEGNQLGAQLARGGAGCLRNKNGKRLSQRDSRSGSAPARKRRGGARAAGQPGGRGAREGEHGVEVPPLLHQLRPRRRSRLRGSASRSAVRRPRCRLGKACSLRRPGGRPARGGDGQRLPQQLQVPAAAHPVGDQPAQRQGGIEAGEPGRHSGDGARHAAGVDHQQHRRLPATWPSPRSSRPRSVAEAPSKRPITPSMTRDVGAGAAAGEGVAAPPRGPSASRRGCGSSGRRRAAW